MAKRIINLEKIMEDFIVHDYIDEQGDNMITCFKEDLKKSYIEFGKQLLELAAENASLLEEWEDSGKKYPEDVITIFNEYNEIDRTIYPDKQSILDTIKQVE